MEILSVHSRNKLLRFCLFVFKRRIAKLIISVKNKLFLDKILLLYKLSHVCASFTSFTKSYLFLSNLASCGRKISSFCFKHYANGILLKTKAADCFCTEVTLN